MFFLFVFFASESPATILSLTSFPYSSQDYVFRYGFIVGACLLAVEAVMVYGADKSFSRSKITLLLSVVAAFALGVIGVVRGSESHLVHDGKRWKKGSLDTQVHTVSYSQAFSVFIMI